MKAGVLHSLTKLATKISNQSTLTSLYRSIELDKLRVRCVSEFGNIELTTEDTGLTKPVLLDTQAVLTQVANLPQDADIVLTEEENKIKWVCGSAKGHWNEVHTDYPIPEITHTTYPWQPPKNLPEALLLASSACQAAAVSYGLYGITMEPDGDKLDFFSSNSIALAATKIDLGGYAGGKATFRPPVPGIIAILIRTCPNVMMDVTKEGIFLSGDWLKAHLPLGADLKHDLKAISGKYTKCEHTAKVDSVSVKKFINRARGLLDKNSSFTVKLIVSEGKLSLSHSGIASSTEEYFMADGLPTDISYEGIDLPADMLLMPLEFVSTVVFDYMKDKQLVLKGENPEFTYILGGE